MKDKIINDFNGHGDMIDIPCSLKYNYPIAVCKDTGLVRVKTLRSAQEIADDWSNIVFNSNQKQGTYTARIPAVRARHTYVADFADTNLQLKGKKVCDIGAGEGQFLEMISSNPYQAEVFGIEPSAKNCEQLKANGFECFNGTIEAYNEHLSESSEKFDVITSMWTLVNSHSPLKMIKTAYEMLKPGGHIVLAEGSRLLVPFKKPLHMYFNTLPPDLHPFHFSANSLSNLLKVCGFKIQEINRYIDTDYLCIIGQKTDNSSEENYEVDNYLEVLSFFERWDNETNLYYPQ